MQKSPTRLYTAQFWLLCLSNVLFAMSFSMILPELPAYLTSLGGEEYKGLIIGLFTLTAGISRPISGKLTDLLGRVPVMIIGSLVCVICSLCYPIFTSVFGFLLLRLVHGFSTGFKPTASLAYVADIVPDNRRGEALGVAGVSGSIGLSGGPVLGSFIAYYFSINTMFLVSSGVAVLATVVILGMKETLLKKQTFHAKMLLLKKEEILHPPSLKPAVITFLVYMPYGVILTIIPDQCEALGIENKGLAFAAFTLASVGSRVIAGKISDRLGRVPVLYLSTLLIGLSFILTGFSDSATFLYVGMAAGGFSLGIGGPAVFAWAIDRSKAIDRGKAMGTINIALEAGIGFGAVFSAYVYANDPSNFLLAFAITGLITLLAIPYLFFRK